MPSHDQIKDPEVERMLGEILICLPQAQRQAKEIGNSERRELSFLFVHEANPSSDNGTCELLHGEVLLLIS